MAALASDWLKHFRLLLWNRWTEFNETWQETRSQHPLPSLCFLGRSEKQDGRPGLWLAETFSTSPLKPLNGIQRNLTGSKISISSTTFVFFGPIGKTRWLPWPLIGWDIFDFSSETFERNSTKLDRKQDLNVLYQVCVFWADRKNKMAALVSDWLRHFRLLLWNGWTEFNETWQEARSECPLLSLCFSGRSEKQDGRPGLWFDETFSTSPLKRLNGFQRNLTGSKISTSSTEFVFFRAIGKTRWPPWPLIGWDIFDFSSETAEWNSTKLDRKQDLNVLYQVCVFWADRKNKMAALASDWLRHFRLLLWHHWTEFNETWQEARSQHPWWIWDWVCVFQADRKNKMAALASDLMRHFRLLLWNGWTDFNETWRKQDLNVLYRVCVFQGDRKNKMAALASDWLRHFRLLLWNRWMEFNETWQETRSQCPLPSLCFWADRKNKMAALASDWLRHFRLLLWNGRTEFNETWQEARSQRPLPSLCFSGRSEKQDGRPGLWLAETFSTYPLKRLNRIQRNLTGSKISTSLMDLRLSLCFSGRSEKQDGRPGLWFDETFSTSPLKRLNRFQRKFPGLFSNIFVHIGQVMWQFTDKYTIWLVDNGLRTV